jgi:transcriptional regulator with XRE-family HTH domain
MRDSAELAALKRIITDAGNQAKAGKRLGVSQAYISAVLRGERPMSERLLGKLGFQRVVVQK